MARTSRPVFTINVTDVNEFDVGAVSDTDATADAVDENAIVGTTVGVTAYATDPDGTDNTVTYTLDDDAGGLFTIDANTGIVTVAGAIDCEADGTSHNITIRATTSDDSASAPRRSRSRSTMWTNSTSAPSPTRMPRPTRWPKMPSSAPRSA